MTHFRFIDVSGVGNSGKSAVVDLLREFDGIYVPEYWFEFDFLRAPNGLLDLRHRLVEDWSPVRSHYGIRAFHDLAEKMGIDPPWWDIRGLLKSTSRRYDKRFDRQFRKSAHAFAESFVKARYPAEWPFDYYFERDSQRFLRKILGRVGLRGQLLRPVMVVDGRDFDTRAARLLDGLYLAFVPRETTRIVFNNGFEPFNPIPALDMLSGSRQIVITRDPRDVYVSGLSRHQVRDEDRKLLPFDNDGLNKSFLATDDLKTFVERQRVSHGQLYRGDDPRTLRLRFENLCLDYDRSLRTILSFLNLDPSTHARPRTKFRPDESARGVGIWKRFSRPEEMAYIEREFPDLIFTSQ